MDNLGRTTLTFEHMVGDRFEIRLSDRIESVPIVVEIVKGRGSGRLSVSVTALPSVRVNRSRRESVIDSKP